MSFKEKLIEIDEVNSIMASLDSGYGNDGQNTDKPTVVIEDGFSNKSGYQTQPVKQNNLSIHMKSLASTLTGPKADLNKVITAKDLNQGYVKEIRERWVQSSAERNATAGRPVQPIGEYQGPMYGEDEVKKESFRLLDANIVKRPKI